MLRNCFRILPMCLAATLSCGGSPAPGPATPAAESPPPVESAATPPAEAPKAEVSKPDAVAATPPVPEGDQASKTTITLLEAGAEPRRKLRYAFSMKPETMIMDMDMKMAMRMGDRVAPETELPTTRTTMRLVPKSVSPEGDLDYEGVVVKSELTSQGGLPPEARKKLEESLKSMQNMKVTSTVSSRGVVKSAEVDIPPNTAPEIRQGLEGMRDALRSMCMPLPEEDVGVGARWKTDMVIRRAFRMNQTTTTTLKKLEPKRLELDAVLAQSAAPQPMTGPGVPAGTSIRVEQVVGNGTGKLAVALDHLVPVSSVAVDNETTMTVSSGAQSMSTATRMHMAIRVKPGK